MKTAFPIFLALLAGPALSEEVRELDAHEHGVGALNIAVEGGKIAMGLHAPGSDIVGFEYAAQNAEDRAAIAEAVATLAKPLELFVLPGSAECSVTQASAELEGGAAHEEHSHEDHEHDHDEHADTEDHDDHEEHAETPGHSEFHAEYMLTCGDTDAISEITFSYFDVFENARALKVQIVTSASAQAFEVTSDTPTLDLRGMF